MSGHVSDGHPPRQNADSVRRWRHRGGDEYVLIVTRLEGPPPHYFEHYVPSGIRHASIAEAKREGFEHCGCDDFNIAAVRRGRLEAVLWMDEVVDDTPEALAERAAAVGAHIDASRAGER